MSKGINGLEFPEKFRKKKINNKPSEKAETNLLDKFDPKILLLP